MFSLKKLNKKKRKKKEREKTKNKDIERGGEVIIAFLFEVLQS